MVGHAPRWRQPPDARVTILGVKDGGAAWARFYMEPVDQGGPDVNGAVREALGAPGSVR